MTAHTESGLGRSRSWTSIALAVCVTALIAFPAGLFAGSYGRLPKPATPTANRVFQLMIYHAQPGKAPALEAVFRDVSKLQTEHGLDILGHWTTTDDNDPAWRDTFVYLIAHPSRAAADANWKALHDDPAFPPYRRAAAPLIQQVNGDYRVDEIYMRPADYSALQ